MAPNKISRYQVERELGQGGMAIVYLAYDPLIERRVAIKILPRHFTHDPQFSNRFRREAQVIAALEHPAIVPIYDFGEDAEVPFIVMRYMAGGSLEDRLKRGALSMADVASLFQRLAPALHQAHVQGIVHRDIKPGNILYDQDGNPYLSDFGLVKLTESQSTALTASGGAMGTPSYMSPEQARGLANVDGRSDIYSLGVVFFQALSGRLPYQADTPIGLAVAHINEPVPNILRAKATLLPQAQQIVERAMAKDPAARYATAPDFAQAVGQLATATSGQPWSLGMSPTIVEPYVDAASQRAPAPHTGPMQRQTAVSPPTTPPPPPRRSVWPWLLGLIALLAGAGALGIFMGFVPNPLATTTGVPLEPTANLILESVPTATATLTVTPLPTPVPPIGSDNTYVEYILDASGSMLELLDNKTKLAIAQDVLTTRLSALPPDINVGLRVYGHRVPWQETEASCADIELVIPIQPNGGDAVIAWLPNMEAQGMTPMSESLRLAAEDFTFEEGRNNFVVLLSDGIETCDLAPAEAVQFMQELGIDFTIHVIGLAVDAETQAQLEALATVANGIYYHANSEAELTAALEDINDDVVEVAAAMSMPTATATAAQTAVSTSTSTPLPTDTPAPLATDTPVPTTPAPTPATVAPVEANYDATFEGIVSASSTYSGYPTTLAVDGDRSTSWFSAGSQVDGDSSVFQWTGSQDDLIATISIISNESHAERSFRTNFGFEAVTIQVLDANNGVVYQELVGLPGTPDPFVTVRPGVNGRSVRLIFTGHESPDCGGFGELQVGVVR